MIDSLFLFYRLRNPENLICEEMSTDLILEERSIKSEGHRHLVEAGSNPVCSFLITKNKRGVMVRRLIQEIQVSMLDAYFFFVPHE